MITGYIRGQALQLRHSVIAADTIDYLTAEFRFLTEEWDQLEKWVHFSSKDQTYEIMLSDDRIAQSAHLNLSEGDWEVYLHGNRYENGSTVERVTTTVASLTVERTGLLDGEPFPSVTPSAGEQVIACAMEALSASESARDAAQASAASSAASSEAAALSANAAQSSAASAAKSQSAAEEALSSAEENAASASVSASSAQSSAASAAASRAAAQEACTAAEQQATLASLAEANAASSASSAADSAASSAASAAIAVDTKAYVDQKLAAVVAANDLLTVPSLIAGNGMEGALRTFAVANVESDELTNICNRFFTAAAKTKSARYTSQFYRYESSNSTLGTKLDANAELLCVPSTNTTAGTDDYANLPLFACFDVNYIIDAATLEPVILAVRDIYGSYSSSPADSFVGVMQMTGWVRRTSTETEKKVEYQSIPESGFQPLPEGVRVDGTVRSFVIHAKYAAGYNTEGLLSSVSGVQPATYRNGSEGSTAISHNGQIAKWREWGQQYGGSGLCDIAFIQLMLEIKYAVLGSAQVMSGCRSYANTYQAAVGETDVTRILLSPTQASYFVEGSAVSLGSTNDRSNAAAYDVCDIVKVVSVEEITVDGVTYGAVNLDTETSFTTTTDTYIVPQPWQTGSTDKVLGNDGSPISNVSGKEPFKIQGIEVMIGAYEAIGDTTLYENAEQYTVYLNRKASEAASDNSGTNPVIVGTIPKQNEAGWTYIAELTWDANDAEAYMLPQPLTGSSTTGYRAAVYRDGAAASGWREWLAFGSLGSGGVGGLACAYLNNLPSTAYWSFAARACGSGGNRGEYAVQ